MLIFLFTGFGGSLCFAPCLVIVTLWFDKRQALAVGIASSGACFGTFVFPPVVNYLLQFYDCQSVLLLLGSVGLHCCISGIVLVERKKSNLSKPSVNDVTVDRHPSNVSSPSQSTANDLNHELIVPREVCRQTAIFTSAGASRALVQLDYKNISVMALKNGERQDLQKPPMLSGKDNNYCHTRKTNIRLSATIASCRRGVRRISVLFGYSVWTDVKFVLFAFCLAFLNLSQRTSQLLLPALVLELGYSIDAAALLLIIIGVSDAATRLLTGLLDLDCLKRYRFCCWLLMLVLFSATTFLLPFIGHFAIIAIACAVNAMGFGCIISQRSVIIYDLLGENRLDSNVAFSIALQGGLVLVGPFIGGKCFEKLPFMCVKILMNQ